ncbi:hypothetical protein VKT23_016803 [Stygiomarasmius scandens]|uniref:Uncharacterized protein n=1 Tax=Marasmiellus scandens TaxID=2682957 RepID=A0ABR1IU57_9AGAR
MAYYQNPVTPVMGTTPSLPIVTQPQPVIPQTVGAPFAQPNVVAGRPVSASPNLGVTTMPGTTGIGMSPYPPAGGSSFGIAMNNLGVGPPVGGVVPGYGGGYGSYPQGYMNSAGYLSTGGYGAGYGTGYGGAYGSAYPMTGYGGGYAPQYGTTGQPPVVVVQGGRRHHHHHRHHSGHHHHHHGLRRSRSYDSYY